MRVHGVQLSPLPAPAPVLLPTLVSEGAALRPWGARDIPMLVCAGADAEIAAYTSIPRWDERTAGRWVVAQRRAARRAMGLCLALCETADGPALGGVSLIALSVANRSAQLGYWLLPAGRGRGLAVTGARLLLAHAATELSLQRFEAHIDPVNERSRSLARRCGFELEGTARGLELWQGRRLDLEIWALLAL